MAGLGGPYYEYYSLASPPLPTCRAYKLIFYSKQIGGTCGTLITSHREKINPIITFTVHPNPVWNELTLNSIANYEISEAAILDLTGQQLLRVKGQNSIDVSKLNPGLYFIKVKSDSDEFSLKFIKE